MNEKSWKLRPEIQRSIRDLNNKKLSSSKDSDKSNESGAEHVGGFSINCLHCGKGGHKIKRLKRKLLNLKQVNIVKPSSRSKAVIQSRIRLLNVLRTLQSGLFINALVDMV